jgi:hypothetical protein
MFSEIISSAGESRAELILRPDDKRSKFFAVSSAVLVKWRRAVMDAML